MKREKTHLSPKEPLLFAPKPWGCPTSRFLKNVTKYYFKHRDTGTQRQNNSLCPCASVFLCFVCVFQNLLMRQPLHCRQGTGDNGHHDFGSYLNDF